MPEPRVGRPHPVRVNRPEQGQAAQRDPGQDGRAAGRPGHELDRRQGHRVAAGEQAGLGHGEGGREEQGRQDQAVAGEAGPSPPPAATRPTPANDSAPSPSRWPRPRRPPPALAGPASVCHCRSRTGVRPVRWRRWSLILVVVAAPGGLALAGRVVDLPEAGPPASTATTGLVSIVTLPPPAAVPEALRRPLRLPGLRGDGSCPASFVAGPPMTAVNPVAAVAVGAGPVYPVLFRAADDRLRPTHVLDPAAAYPGAAQGRWWRPTRLRAGAGCYGLQIDGPNFSQVL